MCIYAHTHVSVTASTIYILKVLGQLPDCEAATPYTFFTWHSWGWLSRVQGRTPSVVPVRGDPNISPKCPIAPRWVLLKDTQTKPHNPKPTTGNSRGCSGFCIATTSRRIRFKARLLLKACHGRLTRPW